MRRKPLSYADAVKLLGGTSPVLGALGKLAGVVGLTTAAAGGVDVALNLLGLRDEAVQLGQDAVVALRNRVMKLNRFKRSELIEAAHAVLVVSSFFEALDDLDAELRTTLNTASMELTRAEQAQLAVGWNPLSGRAGLAEIAGFLVAPAVLPGLDDAGFPLHAFYGELAIRVLAFAKGSAAWDSLNETDQERFGRTAVVQALAGRAISRYEEQLTRLAGEFPEFAFWAQRVGAKRVLDELRESKREITALTGLLATQLDKPDKVRSDLVTRYRAQVAKPVTATVDKVQSPPLRELYVNPSFLECRVTEAASLDERSFTGSAEDLWARVLAHLVSTEATGSPLVLLGQPGAGKSAFTEMLAAELDSRDFLVVRVELRAVPADADIQAQIEAAVRDLTRREIGWADLTDGAGDAQLVVLLDGFDELLQASGITHYDFLEQVAAFQEREADLGHPVAVLVTSRTAVANQVRYPSGTRVLRLEEFTDAQVLEWLNTWNRHNPTRPLSSEDALAQGDLARQPLLLFLLALFQAAGGELTAGIGQALLFDRLFTSFVERDVAKIGSGMSDRERQLAIRQDLDDLSMVAFAMFNRGRQSVTDQELTVDITALETDHSVITTQRTLPLTISERLAGRFFFRLFVHTDRATRGQQQMLSSYEFLHASFGEFLVARWLVSELSRLGTQAQRAAEDPYSAAPLDDGKLRALLSVAPLSTREHRVLDFSGDLLAGLSDDDLGWIRTMLTELLHGCLRQRDAERYPHYRPVPQTVPARYAAYSANLVLLLLALTRSGVPIVELEPAETRLHDDTFYAMTRLWHAQLSRSEWESLLAAVELRGVIGSRIEIGLRGEAVTLVSGRQTLLLPSDPHLADTDRLMPGGWADYSLREAALLGIDDYAAGYETLLPYLALLGESPHYRGGAWLLTLMLTDPWADPGKRLATYKSLLQSENVHITRFALGRMRDDAPRMSPAGVLALTVLAAGFPWTNIAAYLDLLARTYTLAESGRLSRTRLAPADALFLRQFEDLDLAATSPDALVHQLERRTNREAMDRMVSESGWRDHLILLDPGNRLDAVSANELKYLLNPWSPGLSDPLSIVGLRDLLGAHDPRDLLQLLQTSASAAMLDLALWTGYVERSLPSRDRPARLPAIVTDAMQQFVPEFVAKTSRLASEHGYSDPFKLDP
jgi:hypothetical protein